MKICIIGSGLGGLTAGALLAKKGYDVTVLEQHNIVGGSSTTFKRKGGYTCEVGLHEMDGLYSDRIKSFIFDNLGVYENVDFVRIPEFFRFKSDKLDFTMPGGIDESIEALGKLFPNEIKGIKKYFQLIENIAVEFSKIMELKWWQYPFMPLLMPNIFRNKKKSVKYVLDSIIKNEELKLILNTNISYYHNNIDSLSILYHSVAQFSYYNGGGWYIKGGSWKLSQHLAKTITDKGGEIITSAEAKLITENKKNKIITYIKGEIEFTIEADIVISNTSPMNTYKMAEVEYKNDKEIGASLLTVYIGFKNNLKSIYGKRSYSSFFYGKVNTIEEYHNNSKEDVSKRGFVFVDYSQIDSQLVSEEKSFGVFCSLDCLGDWETLSEKDYTEKKKHLAEEYLDKLEEDYPNIRDHIEFYEVSTSRTVKRYLQTHEGTAYGFAPTAKQFFRSPEVKSKLVNNLYFTGAWVLGGGFSAAINIGGLCAQTVMNDFPIKK